MLQKLRPNHLTYGRDINADQITCYNDELLEISGEEMRQNASIFRNIIYYFFKWFMTDYMLALQERHLYQQWKLNNTCVLKVNDVVLAKGDNAPRSPSWKGKVEQLI